MMRLPLAAGRGPLADLSQRPAKVSSIPWDFLGENPPEKPGGTSDVRFASPFDDCDVITLMTQATSLRILRLVPIIESCATAVGLCRDVQMRIYSHY